MMALPPSVKKITVVHRYTNPDGSPSKGSVSFSLSAEGTVPADSASVPPVDVTVVLDDNGAISVDLPASDDPHWAQTGLTYKVTERIAGASPSTFSIVVPYNAIDGVSPLASLAPVVPGPPSTTYILATTVGAVGGVAGPLDANKQLPSTMIPATGSTPDATTTAKGVIQLAGDLSGTALEPTVPGLAAKADTAAMNAALALKAAKPVVRSAYITTGDVTLAANAAWTPLAGFELVLPAAVGDYVELAVAALFQLIGSDFLDLVVLTGGGANTIARRASTGTAAATAADEGDPGLYPNASGNSFRPTAGPFVFTVAVGDLDGGNVRFALVAKGTGGGKVFASVNYPFRWRAINHKVVG